jgi:uncharacterized protein (TIGR02271 family)
MTDHHHDHTNSETTIHDHPGADQPHHHDHLATGNRQVEDTLELREETLQARTREVEAGQVRIGKDVVEERRTLDVPVTHEEVTIERRPVNRQPAAGSISDDSDDQTIRVPVREERVQVEKKPVVYEEIAVDKQEITTTQPVSETVRREEARIETRGDAHPHTED